MLGRTYQGYTQANQSVLEEEDEEDNDSHANGDLEAGPGSRNAGKARSRRRVSRGADASEMSILRPNIKTDDRNQANDSSDDDVPEDIMIETATPAMRNQSSLSSTPLGKVSKGKEREMRRQQPLYTAAFKKAMPPILPGPTPMSIPPRPSELDVDEDMSTAPPPLIEQRPKQMRGLDNYERALWNWVNVYNLDAFLQEAYYYYEGKGIYSIALSKGLNLLLVQSCLPRFRHSLSLSAI